METIRDQNTDGDFNSQQSYERNLSRNYIPSQRAEIRASDQRAAYQAATLKLNAEKEAQNVKDTGIQLGIEQAKEARAVKADKLASKASAAELALKDRDDKRSEMALDQAPLMIAEIETKRGPKGYLSTADETAIRLKFPYAAFSKNEGINKIWNDEGSLRRNLTATEAANSEIRAKEERAKEEINRKFVEDQNKQVLENKAAGELAKFLKLKPTGVRDGKVVFGDDNPVDTGTRSVTTAPSGLQTVKETMPIPPAGKPTPAAPVSTRPIFKDAKGNRAYKNPDGTFEKIP
jgi:hypothetical protein